MSKTALGTTAPDQRQRDLTLDPSRSILVQAPAGSGKTTLLTERFLSLLAEVDEPGQVVAITFTIAAAAEMRNRILDELRADEPSALARRALGHSISRGWKLLDLPAQLRISTIDSFCRDLALQQPLLSGLGGTLEIAQPAEELYRRAARRTMEQIGGPDPALNAAIEALLLWRDNNWADLEGQLVEMLDNRDRWMQGFLIDHEQDWGLLKERLERPLAPNRYTPEEWHIVRACFILLRHAAAQLKVVFAEAGAVDFAEVAQIAQSVLRSPDGAPSDTALTLADGIHHLLVDEFQDTSRRQHQLLASLIAAWPDRTSRTCFVVGDPMQSIYFFRDADAELFPRVRTIGLDIPDEPPHLFNFVPLTANFRTNAGLVKDLNQRFEKIFAVDDGSGVTFSPSVPARAESAWNDPYLSLHFEFVPHTEPFRAVDPAAKLERLYAQEIQTQQIVSLIHSHLPRILETRAARERGEDAKFRVAVLARARKSLVPIAQALREASIPFSAIDLEKLQDRPEVRDALALARALLNPYDRVAWLGVLRAPWCGMALDDLHRLASADSTDLIGRPVLELLAERLPLLSPNGRTAAQRVLTALNSAPALRASNPAASLGAWLEQVWLRLGGADCVDPTARANVDLLWSCLDRLPAGEQDLLGPALDAALDKLTALSDPAASTDCGVQLMTIHKSKGLEFEVVIVPDLQAKTAMGGRKMLSWLERGLLSPDGAARDDSAEITEFLIAPFQSKGADRGSAKAWVDRIYKERESQEDRRILYVAATRAREQLHLFARPDYKVEKDNSLTLLEPSNSLLATAWPALEEEVRARFDEWNAARNARSTMEEAEIATVAASADTKLLVMPSPHKPTVLRRLPPDYQSGAPSFPPHLAEMVGNLESQSSISSSEIRASHLYARHQGGRLSRALGTAVHTLLEELARLRATNDWVVSRAALQRSEPRIAAQMRSTGIDPSHAASIATEALQLAISASQDGTAQWIISPHADAVSEVSWTGVIAGSLTTVRVDRAFRAGLDPLSAGQQAWWIIDYKTAHAGTPGQSPPAALPELRKLFAPQLEAYATMLRNLYGPDAIIRAGLYYPRMLQFDWWEL